MTMMTPSLLMKPKHTNSPLVLTKRQWFTHFTCLCVCVCVCVCVCLCVCVCVAVQEERQRGRERSDGEAESSGVNEEMPVEKILEAEVAVEPKTDTYTAGSPGAPSTPVRHTHLTHTHTHTHTNRESF